MRVFLTIIATLLLVSFAADSSLNVISPHSLSRDFSDGEIDFALSHYGNVPYGTHLTGRLVVIHPVEACSPIERFNKEEEEVIRNPIAVVRRGGCRVAIKTRYAQQAGAKAIIIIDNKDQELTEWFGHEHGAEDIQIPTLLIGKADGDKIVNFDSAANLTHPGYQGIIVSINFSHDKSSSVILDYWYNSADSFGASITFLKEFYSYWQRNNQVIKFRPHIVTWTCAECKKGGFKDDSNKDCVSGGRYCSPDPDDEGPLTGADVVKEDLRQMCVYRQQQKLWWEYTIAVGQECKQEIFECGDRILRKKASSDLYDKVLDCIDNSWEGKKNEKLDNNTILSENKEIQTEYAINHYPVLFINNKPYVGRLPRADKVFEEVCREVDPAPADCNLALARTGEVPLPAETHVGRIIILVVVMLLVAVVCVLYCRRLMKRESKDMSLEVGSMVNRYFSVKDAE